MLNQIADILKTDCQLSPDLPLLVAVSGGPDSLCLFDVLDQLGYPLILAHLDHQLRVESTHEAEILHELASSRGVLACIGKIDVRAYAVENHLSIEEAARVLRYKFLFKQAEQHHAQAVVTGHTADDQVETVLMHFLRGAGLDGLRGMAYRSLPTLWSDTVALVRPMLGVWRMDVLNYLNERGLEPFDDLTNTDVRFYRNRLRHELLPILDSYAPGIRRRLWQTARIVQEDQAVLEPVVAKAYTNCLHAETADWVAFDMTPMRNYPNAVVWHLLRRAAAQLLPQLVDIDFSAVQRACVFICRPPRSQQCDWVAGLRLVIHDQAVWITRWTACLPWEQVAGWPQLVEDQFLTVPGTIYLADGWRLSAEVVTDIEQVFDQAQNNADPFQAWLDAGKIQAPLFIRSRRPGDSLQPLGMHGKTVKLSDLMINLKIPRAARAAWPVVVSGDQIAWAPGLRLAEPFQITDYCRSAIRLSAGN